MDDLIKLEVKSIDGVLLSDEFTFVRIMTDSGDMGIQPGHTFTISDVHEGILECHNSDQQLSLFYISSGVIIVKPETILIIVDYINLASDFDKNQLEDDLKQLKQNLQNVTKYQDKIDILNKIKIAENKLKVTESAH